MNDVADGLSGEAKSLIYLFDRLLCSAGKQDLTAFEGKSVLTAQPGFELLTLFTGKFTHKDRGFHAQSIPEKGRLSQYHCWNCTSNAKWLAGYQAGAANSVFTLGPNTVYVANITPDTTTGIGTWTATDIFNALRNGKDKQGKFLAPVMPWTAFRNLTDDDIYSIAAYLQNVRAVTNTVPANTGPGGGEPDWTHAYDTLQPVPAYPAANENNVP